METTILSRLLKKIEVAKDRFDFDLLEDLLEILGLSDEEIEKEVATLEAEKEAMEAGRPKGYVWS